MARKISNARMAAYNHGCLFGNHYGDMDMSLRHADEYYGKRPALMREFIGGARYGITCRCKGLDITSGQPLNKAESSRFLAENCG